MAFLIHHFMHFVYIIFSEKIDRFYIGETHDINLRLVYHNSAILNTNSTKVGIPWELVLSITCQDRVHARKIEQHIKRMKSKKIILDLIKYPELIENLTFRYLISNGSPR